MTECQLQMTECIAIIIHFISAHATQPPPATAFTFSHCNLITMMLLLRNMFLLFGELFLVIKQYFSTLEFTTPFRSPGKSIDNSLTQNYQPSQLEYENPATMPKFLSRGQSYRAVIGDTIVLPCVTQDLGEECLQSLRTCVRLFQHWEKVEHMLLGRNHLKLAWIFLRIATVLLRVRKELIFLGVMTLTEIWYEFDDLEVLQNQNQMELIEWNLIRATVQIFLIIIFTMVKWDLEKHWSGCESFISSRYPFHSITILTGIDYL